MVDIPSTVVPKEKAKNNFEARKRVLRTLEEIEEMNYC